MNPPDIRPVPLLADEDYDALFKAANLRSSAPPTNIIRVLGYSPHIAELFRATVHQLNEQSPLPMRLRELAILRIAWVTGSVYEWTHHWKIALQLGVPQRDLVSIRSWQHESRLGPADRAVLRAVDDVIEQGSVGRQTLLDCSMHLDAAQLVDLVMTISTWRTASTVLLTFDVPLPDGAELWPPDGVSPDSYGRTDSGSDNLSR